MIACQRSRWAMLASSNSKAKNSQDMVIHDKHMACLRSILWKSFTNPLLSDSSRDKYSAFRPYQKLTHIDRMTAVTLINDMAVNVPRFQTPCVDSTTAASGCRSFLSGWAILKYDRPVVTSPLNLLSFILLDPGTHHTRLRPDASITVVAVTLGDSRT